MSDGQWTLSYGSTSYTFGTPDLGLYLAEAPDLGAVEVRTDDSDRPRQDGRAFGEDFLGGRTITFALESDETRFPSGGGYGGGSYGGDGYGDGDLRAAVLDRIAEAANAWRADEVRSTPGAVATLSASLCGRARRVYGRPRRFAPALQYAREGVAIVTADFACADDLFYGDAEQAVTVGIVPPSSGGLLAPLASPLSTAQSSASKPGVITVGGDVPTWPTMTVHGPITDPVVEVVGLWKITLRTTLASDQSVTIDTRPWSRSIVRTDGGALGGAMTRDSVRISRAKVPPGSHEVVLRGTDATGTASLRFAWREAYSTL